MANEQSGVRFFVVLSLLCLSGTSANEAGPMAEAIANLIKASAQGQTNGLNVMGTVLQTVMQANGGKGFADLLAKDSPAMGLLSSMGSLMGGQKGGKSSGEIDPGMLGTVIDIFSALNEAQKEDGGIEKLAEQTRPKQQQKQKREQKSETDWEPILNVIGSAVGNMMSGDGKSGGGAGLESLMGFLPVIMSSISGGHHPHSSDNVPHHDHAPFLPPFLENFHEYWDHFLNSQLGKTLYENSGLSALMAQFQDESGKVVPEKVFQSLENNAFRRRWIKGISSFVSDWANHISDTETQKRYLETVKVVVNSFLQSEGFPKSTYLDWNQAGESISNFVDHAVEKQLSMKIQSGTYIKPAVIFFQEIFGQSQKKGILASMTASTVESKLMSTLDGELIEPIVRANRGYKFIQRNPQCAKFVVCIINNDAEKNNVGLRPAAAKAANLALAWFASGPGSFLDLYGSTTLNDCQEYDDNCSDFHEEDSKATTEYFHNEL